MSLITRADYVALAFASVFVSALYLMWGASGGHAEDARLGVTGQPEKRIALSRNQIVTAQGALGVSVIEVKDGRIRFIDSPCDNKQCIHSGWLSRAGDFAACLPNRITLFVAGVDAFDTINF